MVNGGGCSNEEGMRLVFDVACVLGMQMNVERDRTQAAVGFPGGPAATCGLHRYGFRAEGDGPRNPSII